MRSTLPRALRPPAGALFAVPLLWAALPGAAHAADAPLRTINVTPENTLTLGYQPIAISLDGRQVLSSGSGDSYFSAQPIIRDVAAGTTTKLLTAQDRPVGASLDLNRILIETDRAISPQDTDDERDLYVHDRAAGTTKLVSGDVVVGAPGKPSDDDDIGRGLISGDGKVVLFRSSWQNYGPQPGTTNTYGRDVWRYDVAAGTLSHVSTWPDALDVGFDQLAIDNAGTVAVTPAGLRAGSKTWPLPIDPAAGYNAFSASVSPDGSTVVYRYVYPKVAGTLTFQSTATGAVSTVKVPQWLVDTNYDIVGAGNAGSGVVLKTRINRTAGSRSVVGWLAKNGALSQIGGDIGKGEPEGVTAVSQNLQFAASARFLAQLGTTALPGSEPVTPKPPVPPTSEYVGVTDTSCSIVPFFNIKTWYKATAGVLLGPIGLDNRKVTGSDWRVWNTTTNQTINQFTLAGGKVKDLTVPRNGGWSWRVKVKFSDGTSDTVTGVIAPHPPYSCD